LSEFLGRKSTYALFGLVALVGAYFFGQASDPIVMMGWGCLFLFAASGSAPSYRMWCAEQYPTPIRAIGHSTCEGIGGRLFGGVVWTAVFPVLVEAFGIGPTMTLIAVIGLVTLFVVVAFAPETAGRSVEELEGQARRPPNGLMNPMDASSRLSDLAGCPAVPRADGATSAAGSSPEARISGGRSPQDDETIACQERWRPAPPVTKLR
jgi:hypothetical protein